MNNSKSPYMLIKTVNFGDCRWTNGFWADKQHQCVKVMIPNLGRLMEDPKISHVYENFLVAAGLTEGEFKGWSFSDGDFYKYTEALTSAYALTKDSNINNHLDEIIGVIAKAQRKDGYIHTMIQIGHGVDGFKHVSEKAFAKKNGPFELSGDHEFYNFGHLMTAACLHYRVTGKTNFLDIAIKASDLLYASFKVPSPELATLAHNDTHIMGLVEMYRTTGDKRYLQLAEAFLNMRGTAKEGPSEGFGLDYAQNRTPFREETEAVGHAVMANYLYAGATDIFAETGEKKLKETLEKIWENVVTEKMHVTGATGPHHFGLSKNRDKVAESYGKNYELPNLDAYNETCANIADGMWNWRMFLSSGDARFTDIMELIFYNSALSGISLDGKHYFYTNPLRFLTGNPNNTKDNGLRSSFQSVFCCPPNIIRTISEMHTYAYAVSEKGVWINLYGGNVLNTKLTDGSDMKLTQETNYPWDGMIKISVDGVKEKEFSMMLRIPSWVSGATLKVNGKVVRDELKPGSYFEIKRLWLDGDIIELNLPMPPQLLEANPFVEETRNQIAIKRGPIVYCLESVDLPKGNKISDIEIPEDIKLKPVLGENELSGITILEGDAKVFQNADWSNKLYRKVVAKKTENVKICLIPYYTWSNRGATDMTVWLPVLWK